MHKYIMLCNYFEFKRLHLCWLSCKLNYNISQISNVAEIHNYILQDCFWKFQQVEVVGISRFYFMKFQNMSNFWKFHPVNTRAGVVFVSMATAVDDFHMYIWEPADGELLSCKGCSCCYRNSSEIV